MAFAGNLGRLFERLHLQVEGRTYLDPLVALIHKTTPPAIAAKLLRYAGVLWRFDNRLHAMALLERSADLYRELGASYRMNLGSTLGVLGGEYLFLDQFDKAEAAFVEAEALLTGGDRKLSLMNVLNGRGYLNVRKGEPDEATRYLMQAREMAHALKDVLRESLILTNLAELDFSVGAPDRAFEHSAEAERGLRSIGDRLDLGMVLINRALYFAHRDDEAHARVSATEALSLVPGNSHRLRLCLLPFAWLIARDGKYAKAAQILGFIKAGAARSGEVLEFTELQIHDPLMTLLATKLTEIDFQLWTAEGALWTEERATEFVLKHIVSPQSPAN
jgi:tetratricopeptide (TPR) repeat protein